MPGTVLIFALILGAIYFVVVSLPRKRARVAQEALLAGVDVGEEVLTAGGLIGVVRGVEGDIVKLELAPGTIVRLDRRAIAGRVLPDDEPGETTRASEPS